ncbi:MAG: response regulator [SAR324 cluster bacterium]|nr:response regulator [SAR324 cluster bacterium]
MNFQSIRILVVDDEFAIRQSYRQILEANQNLSRLKELEDLFDEEDGEPDEFTGDFDQSDDEEILIEEWNIGNYEILEASQGKDALRLIETALAEQAPIALVFLDMRMPPGMNGLETAKRIRQLDPYVEIVIFSAYSDFSYDEIIAEVGNPDRLLSFHKPFKPAQIRQLTTSLTQKWLIENREREQDDSWTDEMPD